MTFPPLKHSPRYQALDLWRGIFCLIVVLEHAGVALWRGMGEGTGLEGWLRLRFVQALQLNVGTPLFFVISGYCIAASIDSTRRKGLSPAHFLARRFWRIFPPYWAALFVFVAVVATLDHFGLDRLHRSAFGLELTSPGELNRAQWLGNLTLTETWRPHIAGSYGVVFTRMAWSLCYQEQFYLICFLALVLTPTRLYGALAAATAAILTVRVAAWDMGASHRIDGMFPYLWHEFAVGLAVYWRLNVLDSKMARHAVDLALVGLMVAACTNGLISTTASAGFGLLLIALRRFDDQLGSLSGLDLVRACGRRSYSIYLIHLPVCVVGNAVLGELGLTSYGARAFLMVPITSAAAIGVGWAFHRWIDHHFQSLPRFFPIRQTSNRVLPAIA
ncbi:MAG: acyltransferase [Isosphaeraceae bacterium]